MSGCGQKPQHEVFSAAQIERCDIAVPQRILVDLKLKVSCQLGPVGCCQSLFNADLKNRLKAAKDSGIPAFLVLYLKSIC
jgi:hypothetical protein